MTDEAYWTNGGGTTGYPRLDGRARADVAVIGAGAAGLWTAYELARTGRRVAVLEAGRIGAAAKGGGAGQGSVIQALAYSRIARAAGADAARCYAQAQIWALARLAEVAGWLDADCELERRPAYVYAADPRFLPELHEEWAAAIEAGVSAGYGTETGSETGTGNRTGGGIGAETGSEAAGAAPAGLPLSVAGALRVDDQLQFHPRKLFTALAKELVRRGSSVYGHSRAVTVDPGEPCVVMTESGGSVAAEHVVIATGFPIAGTAALRRALRPRRELLLAGAVPADRAPAGMYAAVGAGGDSEATIRTAPLDARRRMVVVAGERYKPGSGGTGARFARLAAWAAANAGLTEAEFRWSAQDYETDDRIPLIGRVSTAPEWRGLWIATGFAGWEAPNAVLAGRLITAGIRGERLPEWAAPFAPARLEKAARLEDAWSGPARSVVRHAVERRERDALDAIRPGEGAVVEVGGEHCAAYRDENGLLRMVSALCPHRGCTVGFNDAEKTWECPCHGSRFATDGTLLQGPAREPLALARAYLALASAE